MKAKHLLTVSVAMLASFCATAQDWTNYVDGGVYRVVNVAKPDMCLTAHGFGATVGTDKTADGNDSQLWQLKRSNSGSGFYLCNLNNGAYLTSSIKVSGQWSAMATTTPDNKSVFKIEDSGTYKTFRSIEGVSYSMSYMYAHSDNANAVVCWSADDDRSRWNFSLVESITPAEADKIIEQVQSIWSISAEEFQVHLDALFEDKACTTLRAAYRSASDATLAADAHYSALPDALKSMVRKVRDNNWAETYASGTNWDSDHARKFRVQLYEPFSRGYEGSEMIGVQAYTNMNNPTGLIADNKSMLYVMVEEDVPEGALLTIGSAPGDGLYNDFNGQFTLHKGLNIVPIWNDNALQYIYYTVDTWDSTRKVRKYRLDDFSPIKIHIEGGEINGHFNSIGDELYTPDTNDDWKYYRSRARHNMFDLIGEHVILHFFINNPLEGGYDLRDEFDESARSYDIPDIIRYWDDIVFYQKMLMGVLSDDDIRSDRARRIGYDNPTYETLYDPLTGDDVCPADYHHYLNSRMMGLSINESYMNGGAWRTAYNATTMHGILTGIVEDPVNLWGPAHEHGHVNQQLMKIAGTTEESNNIFSNVAVYYRGVSTARTDLPSKQLDVFNRGLTFLKNDTWGTTRMFYQLWLYYHACGHNRKFYPRLMELLRQNPLEKRGGNNNLQSRYDLLHFAKMCCVAAGEDLTDFFTAWGFFVVQDGFFIDDYSQYYSYLSQADIDAVKAEIAAYGYPKNTAILFIDDRPGSSRTSWDADMAIENAGTMGGLNDFRNGSTASGDYSFSLSGNTLTISGGTGGVGFMLYDADGNLIGFSNNPTFTLSDEAARLVASGQATVSVISSDSSSKAVADPVETGTPAQKRALLDQLIAAVRNFRATRVDDSGRTVGRIAPAYVTELDEVLNAISAKIENSSLADSELTEQYRTLADAYYRLMCNDAAYIDFIPGKAYVLTNASYIDCILSSDGSKLTAVANGSHEEPANQWYLESASTDGSYVFYLRNAQYNTYAGIINTFSQSISMSSTPVSYTLDQFSRDVYSPRSTENGSYYAIHVDGRKNVVGWMTTEPHSQWIFSLVSSEQDDEASRSRLAKLVADTEQLLQEVGTVSLSEELTRIDLDPELMYSNACYTGEGTADKFTSFSVLTDNDVDTYFHSDYSGANTTDGLDHYIRITMPSGVNLADYDFLKLNYTTRNSSAHWSPSAISIEESANLGSWYTALTENSGLPAGQNLTYQTDAFFIPDGTKHVRFTVTDSDSDEKGGHKFFVLSELGLSGGSFVAEPASTAFPHVTSALMLNAKRLAVSSDIVVNSAGTARETYDAKYDALKTAYDALLAAKDDMSAPAEIEVPVPAACPPVIFDLSGRRVEAPSRGIYIINGRAVRVK